jgi:zinc protease
MKNYFNYILVAGALLVVCSLHAQKDPSYDMMVNGVKVIVKPSGNNIVVIQTLIKGGVQNYTADKAGIESLTMTALTECGTEKDDKNSFKNKLDKVSAQVSGYTGVDFATFRMNCIKSDFDEVWPLYTSSMLMPKFDAKEFDRIKQDAINGIRANESNPDFAIDNMAKQTAFAGQKYAMDPQGTVKSVTAITADQAKKYWKSIFTKSRMVIIVVADLDKDVIENKVKAFLAAVPTGTPFKMKKQSYTAAQTSFKAQQRENATNYVQGITGGPQPGTPDFNAFVLAMRIFSTRHFIEIRSKNGLSYAPGAWFSAGTNNYSNIYVTTTDPNKYIAVARQLIDKVKKEGFSADELKNEKTGYITGLYYRDETNDALAGSLASNEVIHGNWKRAFAIKDNMNDVTLDQLNNVFKKYVTNITWTYQGDPKKVNQQLFTQKETPKIPEEKKGF